MRSQIQTTKLQTVGHCQPASVVERIVLDVNSVNLMMYSQPEHRESIALFGGHLLPEVSAPLLQSRGRGRCPGFHVPITFIVRRLLLRTSPSLVSFIALTISAANGFSLVIETAAREPSASVAPRHFLREPSYCKKKIIFTHILYLNA